MALEAAYDYLHVAVVQCTPTQAAAVLGVLLLLAIRLAAAARSSSATSPKWKQHRLPPTPPGKLPIIGHLHLIGSHPHVSFAPYGEYWRTARKVVNTHLLSAKMVFSKRREREEEVRLVVARIRDAAEASPGTALDMTELLGGYASDFVCRAVLGESHRKQGRNKLFRELTETSAALLGGFNVEDYFPSPPSRSCSRTSSTISTGRCPPRWSAPGPRWTCPISSG
ncbi:benzoxazinone synthesis4 [Zea mays]|uniref:Benzoxazinone synthesis4 n=1 Tax=Zea mays TaxID=4577 RepID=A0A1D6PP65_MAIZE|nr:benzoxazinone synthesis4 [Zea mays]